VLLLKTFIMASRTLFGRGWYSTVPMFLISEPCDTTANPGPAHPAFFGDDVPGARQLVSAQDDECGTDKEFQP
jgi:hypothetical protein